MPDRVSLLPHATTPCAAISAITVAVDRISSVALTLHYVVSGEVGKLRIPAQPVRQRVDELWRHTCAEMFIAAAKADAYLEWNFSPSSAWAAYEFSAYRQDMRLADVNAPTIYTTLSAESLSQEVLLDLPQSLQASASLQIGLTMVIEDMNGQCSYWALAHDAERPDFHRREIFILTI